MRSECSGSSDAPCIRLESPFLQSSFGDLFFRWCLPVWRISAPKTHPMFDLVWDGKRVHGLPRAWLRLSFTDTLSEQFRGCSIFSILRIRCRRTDQYHKAARIHSEKLKLHLLGDEANHHTFYRRFWQPYCMTRDLLAFIDTLAPLAFTEVEWIRPLDSLLRFWDGTETTSFIWFILSSWLWITWYLLQSVSQLTYLDRI